MKSYSTREAAKKLGLSHGTLAHYVAVGKVPSPQMVTTGTTTTHIWSEEQIEETRKLLPKIANGRKTRYTKQKKTAQKKAKK
jgi:recombinational DNA repair protein RecT